MKSRGKRILAGLLSLAMIFSTNTMQAFAAGETGSEGSGGIGWEDPDYSNSLGTEVFPNTGLDDWDRAVTSSEVETRLDGGVKKIYTSYNPGTEVSLDENGWLQLCDEDEDGTAYSGLAERLYHQVFSPKLVVPDEEDENNEVVYTPTKITGITYNVSKSGAPILDGYHSVAANSDQVVGIDNKDPGLCLSFNILESGEYVVDVSFYAYFGEIDTAPINGDELYKWYECTYQFTINVEYGYRFNLYDYYANATTKMVDIESSNKYYNWDLSAYEPEERPGYTFLGWSSKQDDASSIITTKKTDFASKLNKDTLYVQGSNARTIDEVYAIFEEKEARPHQLTYDLQGGKWANLEPMVINIDSYRDVESIPVTDFTVEREGYIFKGWSTDPDAETADLNAGDNLQVPTTGLTIYALWELEAEIESHYFINIWGETEEGKEYSFEGPTVGNKVVLTIPVKDVEMDINYATYSFNSSKINDWFGAYGVEYYTTTENAAIEHQNGYHKPSSSWDVSWPVDGGTVDIIYNLTGYDFTINWYNKKTDIDPAKIDVTYSASPITDIEMNPPTPPSIVGQRLVGWNQTGHIGTPLVEKIEVGNSYNISLYPVYVPIESTYVVTHKYYVIDGDGTKTFEGEVSEDPATGNVGQVVELNSTDPAAIVVSAKLRAAYGDGSHNYSVAKTPENPVILTEDEEAEYIIEYNRNKCVGSVTFKAVYNVNDKDGNCIQTYRSSTNPTYNYEEGTVVSVDKDTAYIVANGEFQGTKTVFDINGTFDDKDFTYTVSDTSEDITIQHSTGYDYTITFEYTYDKSSDTPPAEEPDEPDEPDGDAKYFINIWGVTPEGKDYEFQGPTVDNKVTIPIYNKQVTTDPYWATYTFDSSIMDKYFGYYGVDYDTTTVGSGASHQNGVHKAGAVWDVSWPVEGGSVDVIYNLTGYSFTVKYYASRGEYRTIQEDTTYSATSIDKVTLTPPEAPEKYGMNHIGWNEMGDLNDPLVTEVEVGNAYEISLYPVYEPIKTSYQIVHRYYITDKDGNKTLEGEVVDDPLEGNVGQKLVYNGADPADINIKPSIAAEYEDGLHNYNVIATPTEEIALVEGETKQFVIEYGRERCIGTVTFKITCNVVNKEGVVLNSYLADAKPKFNYVEGSVVSFDKDTASFMTNGTIDKDKNPISLDGSYLNMEFEYAVSETDGDLTIEHGKEYDYNVILSYEYDDKAPAPATKTNVKVHHEYYVDNNGTLTKEYEYDEEFTDIDIGTTIDKAFHDANHKPAEASQATVNGVTKNYTEYERSEDMKAEADNKTVYTVKYKRVPGVKYIIRHEYYINNEGSTYVHEKTVDEEGEAVAGTHISVFSVDPNCIIVSPKLVIEINNKSYTYEYASADPEKAIAADGSTIFSIRYERKWTGGDGVVNANYTVSHEYYIADSSGNLTKEGSLTETGTGMSGSKIGLVSDGSNGFVVVSQKTTYTINGMTYTYTKYNEDPVTTIAQNGTTIYTIKYMRQSGGDATRLGQYVVNHDLYKQDANGVWVLERRVTEDTKFASVGSIIGVKTDSNGVTLDIPKMTFKETEGTKTKEYQFKTATDPVTLNADSVANITLSYYYTEYDTVQPVADNKPENTDPTPAPTATHEPPKDEAPKTGDNFKVSAMMPLSGVLSLVCIGVLTNGKKKKENE